MKRQILGLLILILGVLAVHVPAQDGANAEERLRRQRAIIIERMKQRQENEARLRMATPGAPNAPMPASEPMAAPPVGAPPRSPQILYEAVQSPSAPSPVGEPVAIDRWSEGERVNGVLWPGESYAFQGVTLTWTMTEADQATSTPLGFLSLKGPRTSMPRVPWFAIGPGSRGQFTRSVTFFLDGVVYRVEASIVADEKGIRINGGINYAAWRQPVKFLLTAAPAEGGLLYVSPPCPLTIGPWKLSVSAAPVAYPDGSQYYQLKVLNTTDGTSATLPATQGSRRTVGRLNIDVEEFNEYSATAAIGLKIDPDPRPLGGDSYGSIQVEFNERYEDILSRLAEQYKFSIEWVPFPAGHPESVEYAQDLKITNPGVIGTGIIKEVLKGNFENDRKVARDKMLALEWSDAQHLRVWAKNFDNFVAEKEAREKESQARERELARLKETFTRDYTPVLQIYPLSRISAATARALVEPELSAFHLVEKQAIRQMMDNRIAEKGDYFTILKDSASQPVGIEKLINPAYVNAVQETSKETIVVDDRANALIVKAAPRTQARVKDIIAKMDVMVGEARDAGPTTQYRIEVTLLEGATEPKPDPKAQYSPSDPVVTFEGKEYLPQRATVDRNHYQIEIEYEGRDTATTASQKIVVPYSPDWAYRASEITLFKSGGKDRLKIIYRQGPKPSASAALKSPSDYGLSPEDLKVMGFDKVRELGRGVAALAGQKGDVGKVILSLSDAYRCQLEYQDFRKPYLIAKGGLLGDKPDKPLLSNTLFLEPGKQSLLGLTNLKQALILLVKWTP